MKQNEGSKIDQVYTVIWHAEALSTNYARITVYPCGLKLIFNPIPYKKIKMDCIPKI